ncbi:hypothetical protein E2C01_087080 [Portunus trituberculatus]|uniref:Uncharacterized protein n=1 Tax=Portunus trituberculatus TaxID=210409 RepID=A0A5B7J773_PORTR|nr:hypothetical protein [Portunus trituberculatus]
MLAAPKHIQTYRGSDPSILLDGNTYQGPQNRRSTYEALKMCLICTSMTSEDSKVV